MPAIDNAELLASVRRAVEQQERERVQAVRDQYYAVEAPIVIGFDGSHASHALVKLDNGGRLFVLPEDNAETAA